MIEQDYWQLLSDEETAEWRQLLEERRRREETRRRRDRAENPQGETTT